MSRLASATRHFTVPSGTCRIAAISSYVCSPVAASSSVSLSFGDSRAMADAHVPGQIDGYGDALRIGPATRQGFDRVDLVGARARGARTHPRPPGLPLPAFVERLAPRDREQPRPERRLAAETAELLPGHDERVLGGVLGVFAHPERGQRRAQHDALVERDQVAKRLAVATARRLDQRLHARGLPALGNRRVLGVDERHEVGDGDRH